MSHAPFPAPPVRHRADAQDLATFVAWQSETPVVRLTGLGGAPVWMVTRHEDVRSLLTDKRLSADMSQQGFPMGTSNEPTERIAFIRMDGDRHATIRRSAIGEFRAATLQQRDAVLVDDVRARVRHFLDDPTRRADLVPGLAIPLPALVIARTLGVPEDRVGVFRDLASELYRGVVPGDLETFAHRAQTFDELRSLIRGIIADVRSDPADREGLIPSMLASADAGRITDQDVENSAVIMLVAGHDATSAMIALSTLVLLLHPHVVDRLRAAPDGMASTVEELLRFLSVTQKIISRVVLEDIELHGHVLPAGEGVLLLNAAANHDTSVFADPFTFDPSRPRVTDHLAFGHGVHSCIGQNLARRVVALVLHELLVLAPTLRLDCDLSSLDYAHMAAVTSLHSLPVSW